MSEIPPDRATAILAVLRREITYPEVAQQFGVPLADIQQWEADFIAGGAATLNDRARIADLQGRIDEAQAQLSQISALNAISQSLSAILDLDKLLDATLNTLRWVFGYVPTLSLVSGEDLVIKGGYALDGTRLNWYEARLPISTGMTIETWTVVNGRPLNVPDVLEDSRYISQEVVGPVRSELAIPMVSKGAVLGVLDVKSDKVHAFDANDMNVLETVAFQLATAIDNARLFDTVHRRVTQLEIIQSVTSKAIENFDVPAIITYAVEQTYNVTGYTGVAIGLIEPDHRLKLTTVALAPDGEAPLEEIYLPIDDSTVIGSAARTGQVIMANDVRADARFALNPLLRSSQSELVVPLRSKDKVIGIINVESDQPGAFDETDLATLTLLADQLTIAIRGAALFQQTQTQLREISLFRRLADEAIVGIITRDLDGLIDYTNTAAARMFGFPDAASMAGLKMNVLYPDDHWYRLDRELCLKAARDGGWSGEVTQRRQDGRVIVSDLSVFPISAPDGALITYGMVLQDATERHDLIDAMQQANARFLAVLDATDDGIVVWDEDWHVLFANPAALSLLDVPANKLIGRCRDDAVAPALLAQIAYAHSDQQIEFAGPQPRVGHCRNLPWRSDMASGYVTVIHDITNQIVLETSREEMTSMLIHDLRGPLSSIVGGVELAQMGLDEEKEAAYMGNYLAMAMRGALMLMNLTDSLLDIRRFETGQPVLQIAPLQLDTMLSDVLALLSNAAEAASIQVTTTRAPDLPDIAMDNAMVRRVLTNLMDNAIKYTPDGGQITLSVQREGGPDSKMIRFSVADTGPGVPEAFRKRIFEKYTHVPNQKARRRGTGLGLAFCRFVAEAHHGRVWVEPRPGGGSVFCVVIADMTSDGKRWLA